MERLIRYRGLTKRVISRRARLLHNVYAWMRIISESTNVLHDEVQSSKCTEPSAAANCCTAENPAEGSSLHDSQEVTARGLDDFLYLEEYRTQANHNATTHRDSSEGQLDLHLTNPLIDRDGMCMQIYGVPETWLRLVSQTTRLANMLDELDPSTAGADMEVFARLQTTSATLESAVCAFKERFRPLLPGASPHEHMVRALSASLVIFFYRRIRNIRPLMLQESVMQTIASLRAFDAALEQHGMPGPGTAWPAFIAGAEAMHPPQRQAITAWLSKAHSKSGWKGYTTSQCVLNELWKRRDDVVGIGSHELPTWVGVCKDLQCWPLLC
jgi:arginine metabolism regulation protein II